MRSARSARRICWSPSRRALRAFGLWGAAGLLHAAESAGASAQELPRWQLWHPPAATPSAAMIEDLHLLLFWVMAAICALVIGLMVYVALRFREGRHPVPNRTTHNTLVEVVWTVLPVVILVLIAIPSFRTLYTVDRIAEADLTVKATGYQWYWGYEYPDQGALAFDSLPVAEEDLEPGQPRLLQADNALVVPVGARVRLLTTAADVIHSFAVPAFGVKVDAVPGRTNESWFQATREGTFYGQCSELCGTNHYFMPIMVRVVPQAEFDTWLRAAQEEFASRSGPSLAAAADPGG